MVLGVFLALFVNTNSPVFFVFFYFKNKKVKKLVYFIYDKGNDSDFTYNIFNNIDVSIHFNVLTQSYSIIRNQLVWQLLNIYIQIVKQIERYKQLYIVYYVKFSILRIFRFVLL